MRQWIHRAWLVALVTFFGAQGALLGSGLAVEVPIRTVTVTMDRDLLQMFLEHLRAVADRNAFAIRIGQSSPDPDDVLVQMWREDLKVIGFNSLESTEETIEFFVGIYNNSDSPVPMEASDKLVQEIGSAVEGTPGASLKQME
jgi:hypothetical protein